MSKWTDKDGLGDAKRFTKCSQRAEFIRAIVRKYCAVDARILELGCGVGRDIANLYDLGYDNLTGIDINPHAIAIMEHEYPYAYYSSDIKCGKIETLLPEINQYFDLIYTFSVLQHIEPDKIEDVIATMIDISELCITVENEGAQKGEYIWQYNYKGLFEAYGASQIETRECKTNEPYRGNYTARVFDCGAVR